MMSPAKRSAENTDQLRASPIQHARRLVNRDGAAVLTMRALAVEAGCAVGLLYKARGAAARVGWPRVAAAVAPIYASPRVR
jgi:hypothetical protein